MKAIVVTDQAAGTAGMTLVERPEPQAAINDVVVQVHASGFTSGELTWLSTWTDRLGRDHAPSMHAARRNCPDRPAASYQHAEGNLGNYPWPLALDVERAFQDCNISTKETNDQGDH